MLFHSTMRGIAAALLSTLAVSATLSIPAQAQRPLRLTLGISTPVKHSGQTSQGFLFGGGNYDSTAPFLVAGLSYDLTRQTEERRPAYSAYWDNGVTLSIFSPSADFSGLGVSARFPGGPATTTAAVWASTAGTPVRPRHPIPRRAPGRAASCLSAIREAASSSGSST